MHVYVPLGAKYIHEQAKMFGEIVARLVHRQLPAATSLDPRLARIIHFGAIKVAFIRV